MKIKDSKLFNYIDSDFEKWNVVDSEQIKKRELKYSKLKENKTFSQIFNNPEKQWVSQEEILDFCENKKDLLSKKGSIFFLLKTDSGFFVAYVYVNSDGYVNVYVYDLSNVYEWVASSEHRIVVPATKPELLKPLKPLEPQALNNQYLEILEWVASRDNIKKSELVSKLKEVLLN